MGITDHAKAMLRRHAEIAISIKALETEKDLTKDIILEILRTDLDGKFAVDDLGTLSIGTRKKWEYPAVVADIEDALKEAKKNAEADGTAAFTESEFLTFRAKG